MTDRELVMSMKPKAGGMGSGCEKDWGGRGTFTETMGGSRSQICKKHSYFEGKAALTAEEPGRVLGFLFLISATEAGASTSAVVSNEIIGSCLLLNHGFTHRGRCEVNPGSARLRDGAATSPRRVGW